MNTWADVERAAFDDQIFRHAVTMVHLGEWTREQALIALAFAQMEARQRLHAALVEHMNTATPRLVLAERAGVFFLKEES